MTRVAAVALVLSTAGCELTGFAVADASFQCTDDRSCGTGGRCVGGRCRSDCQKEEFSCTNGRDDDCNGLIDCADRACGCDAGSTDAGLSDAGSTDAGLSDAGLSDAGSTDAGSTDAGVFDAGRPSLSSLRDDFASATLGAAWSSFALPGVQTVSRPGAREVRVDVLADGGRCTSLCYGGFITVETYDARDAGATLEVIDFGPPSTEAYMKIRDVSDRYNASISIAQRKAIAYLKVDGGPLEFLGESPPLAAGRPVVIRVRHAAGNVFWEYLDGGSYAAFAVMPTPFDFSSIQVEFGAGAEGADAGTSWTFGGFNAQ